MARIKRGQRDGTGPFSGGIGRRQAAGEPCPVKKKKGILGEDDGIF